jgi:hypothetical protein
MTAAVGLVLLVTGGVVLWSRPWREMGDQHPRVVVALVLAAAAGVWAGSLGVTLFALTGEHGSFVRACETLWRQLATGQLAWWQWSIATVWFLAFPTRAATNGALSLRQTWLLQRRLGAVATPVIEGGVRAFTVPSLGTPAITVGLLRPRILVDATFWQGSPRHARSVVLAHEDAHRAGRHSIAELVGKTLLCPIPGARAASTSVRVHLEAIADDVAAHAHGREAVGRTLGLVALADLPAAGLGMAGASVWRVSRLLAADRSRRGVFLGTAVAMLVVLGVGSGVTLYGVAETLFIAASYCLL